ncbi:class I SAM-dependent methyltransferase [Comamonas thiooxydans]|uniref:class I SAM-dependent methyltransferase n=1 Tax=Comamonas thiooxydans TaxID=363952 RepID=UPI000B40F107|nr:class I SAM-dependent methyltransferase [Comamonas thiooxydans]
MLNPALGQWFTPAWAAEGIIDSQFSWLKAGDTVIEPSCGDGAFLCAMPSYVTAVGIEVDPVQAAFARANSGREVVVGDFLNVPLDHLGQVQAVIGNPPFQSDLVAGFLKRCHGLLEEGGQAGFILPAYILQTSSKVEEFAKSYSVHQQLLPRNLFPGLKLPLVFAKFIKEEHRQLFGFLLYQQAQEVRAMQKDVRAQLEQTRSKGSVWRHVLITVISALGGRAELQEIYLAIQGRRPTDNPSWKEKVRQTLRRHPDVFCAAGSGVYALAC